MTWWQAAGWGLAGGLAAGILGLMTTVIQRGFKWWDPAERGPRLFVLCCGLGLGALVAAAASSQISGPWPAFVIGAGAPATIRGLLSGVHVDVKVPALEQIPAPSEPATEGQVSENAG